MNKKFKYLFLSLSIFGSALLFVFVLIFILRKQISNFEIVSTWFLSLFCLTCVAFLFLFFKVFIMKNAGIKYTMNNFDSYLISNIGFGLIVLSEDDDILWVSSFVADRFSSSILNKKIWFLISSFKNREHDVDYETVIFKNGLYYQVNYLANKKMVLLKEVTNEQLILDRYNKEKYVMGELDIDNFQKYQSSLSEEELFSILSLINQTLEKISQKYNLFFKPYSNGRFILFTNEAVLAKLEKSNFEDFSEIAKFNKIKNIQISLSMGFGYNTSSFNQLTEITKGALLQAQSRGGNQIAVSPYNKPTRFYGSKSEIATDKNRSLIKLIATNLKTRLLSPEITKVIIYGHISADLDAIGAAYAMYRIAIAHKKEAYIQNQIFDKTARKSLDTHFDINDQKKIFITKSRAYNLTDKNTLVIIVDCSEKTRVENNRLFEKTEDDNVFIFDHHRVSKINENINPFNVYIESTASSTCEIVTELLVFNNYLKYLDNRATQMLLDGIFLDTDKFQKATSSRTFTAAAVLEDYGAKTSKSIEILKMSQTDSKLLSQILKTLQEIKPGYWLASYNGEVPIDVISTAANEILRISERKAAFVIARLPKKSLIDKKNQYKLSARGLNTNVQVIAEAVGGGGHFSSAAAVSDASVNETFEIFRDNVIQAIISAK